MKTTFRTILKVTGCGLAFFFGDILGGVAVSALGLPAPEMPPGSDPNLLMLVLLIASLGIAATLGYIATRLSGPFALRWLALAGCGWGLYALNTYLDAVIYTTLSSASPYKLVMDAVAFTAAGGLAARLFRPRAAAAQAIARKFTPAGWAWRLALAWVGFPLIYLGFGKLVEPFVIDMYRQQLMGMTAPGWGQIIPIQMLRSVVFLACGLALLHLWNGERRYVWAALGITTFLLLWGFYGIQAYWLPVGFRLAHSLEILADSLVYAGLLQLLFVTPAPGKALVSAVA